MHLVESFEIVYPDSHLVHWDYDIQFKHLGIKLLHKRHFLFPRVLSATSKSFYFYSEFYKYYHKFLEFSFLITIN